MLALLEISHRKGSAKKWDKVGTGFSKYYLKEINWTSFLPGLLHTKSKSAHPKAFWSPLLLQDVGHNHSPTT